MAESPRRRSLIALGAGALLLPSACAKPAGAARAKDVGAVEDLMREHGVLRRVLLVYDELTDRLRAGDYRFDPHVLADAAQLFPEFGEDYHARMLEEAFIFPRVRKTGGQAGEAAGILQTQHERGREITDYIGAVGKSGRIAEPQTLQKTLRSMVLMYENHTAREDVIVFPAWKASLSEAAYRDASEQFEDIERKVFGRDGFDHADKSIAAIEKRLGLADLAGFTAPSPPRPEPSLA